MTTLALHSLAQQGSFWLPPQGSEYSASHDFVFQTVLYVTGFFFVLVISLMLVFIIKYRRRPGVITEGGPTHNTPLEVAWTGIPLIIVIALFYMGFTRFMDFDSPPANAEVVDVEGKQWAFTFTYANGGISEKLYLQKDQPFKLQMHSSDVTHSLYIPDFRVQRNIVPNRTVEMWFTPTVLGSHYIFCTQYCGNGHSRMTTEAIVLDSASYQAKLVELANIFNDPVTKQPLPYRDVGEKMYKTSLNCSQCHSINGSVGQGPTWQGLFKRPHEFSVAPAGYSLSPGDPDDKWDAFLRQHILTPGVTVVKGFQNVMPSYAAQFSGSSYKEKKLEAIIEYIKSLDNHGPNGTPQYYRPMPTPAATTSGPAVGATSAPATSTGKP